MRKYTYLLVAMALFFNSCWINPVTGGLFVRAISIVGSLVADYVIFETIYNVIDMSYRSIFKTAADKTEDAVQADIRPISRSQPLLGMKKSDHCYLVQSAVNQSDNTITIPTEKILFRRDDEYSKWYLTQESNALIRERLEVATIQHALILKGYPTGRMDGILGYKTDKALKMFQQDMGLDQTGRADETTSEILLGKQ